MRTVELREQALALARQLGYCIREEWLDGNGGGSCEFSGRRWIFVDLAQSAVEQLDQVADALRSDPMLGSVSLSPPLRKLLAARKTG